MTNIPANHYILLAVQKQINGLVAEKAALQQQIDGLVIERDELRKLLNTAQQIIDKTTLPEVVAGE